MGWLLLLCGVVAAGLLLPWLAQAGGLRLMLSLFVLIALAAVAMSVHALASSSPRPAAPDLSLSDWTACYAPPNGATTTYVGPARQAPSPCFPKAPDYGPYDHSPLPALPPPP